MGLGRGQEPKDSEVSVSENLKRQEETVGRNLDSEELLVRALREVSSIICCWEQRKGESRYVAAECLTISCSSVKSRKCTQCLGGSCQEISGQRAEGAAWCGKMGGEMGAKKEVATRKGVRTSSF